MREIVKKKKEKDTDNERYIVRCIKRDIYMDGNTVREPDRRREER